MVKLYAIFLLSVFSLYLVLPAMPWIDYYLNKSYIVENLCEQRNEEVNTCNGSCHLKKEINKATEEHSNPKDSQPRTQNELKISPSELTILEAIEPNQMTQNSVKGLFILPVYSYAFSSIFFHPPELML